MRFVKSLIILLVFMMASEPALASACTAKCATQQLQVDVKNMVNNLDSMAGMEHCHESTSKQNKIKDVDNTNHSHQQHTTCAMGALCGFSQIATSAIVSKLQLAESSILVFPKFNPTEKSIDLSPPLKPPA